MLIRKISNGNSFHGTAILEGYVHIPVAMQTATAFFDMIKSVDGVIGGHFVSSENNVANDPFYHDFILVTKEIINGKDNTEQFSLFNLYILNDVYYRKIVLPDEFDIHFILKVDENSHIAEIKTGQTQIGKLHSAIIPGVLK